jgi:ribosomal-protein-alanine N-acetyltransferase
VEHAVQSGTYHIRRATEKDGGAIEAINRRAWVGNITTYELLERRHGPVGGCPWTERVMADIAAHLARPDVTTFVAEKSGRVIGYAAAQIRPDGQSDVGVVSYNAVDPGFRGLGVGTSLLQHVMSYLKQQGARVLEVVTLDTDEPARRLYERMGFQELVRLVYYTKDAQGVEDTWLRGNGP